MAAAMQQAQQAVGGAQVQLRAPDIKYVNVNESKIRL